jgi:hypothetical protein
MNGSTDAEKMMPVGRSCHALHTRNTRNIVLPCFSYGVAFSSISRMVSASATYMNTPLQLSQVSCQFQFLALFAFCCAVLKVEQIDVGECLLSFSAGSSVFQFAIQKYKD